MLKKNVKTKIKIFKCKQNKREISGEKKKDVGTKGNNKKTRKVF
jgi:hypothetical protein